VIAKSIWIVLGVFTAVAVAGAFGWTLLEEGVAQGRRLQPNDPAMVAVGKGIYAEQCAVCHGANLEGQPNWRQRLANGRLPAPPHDATGHTRHHPDEQLISLTKYGPAAIVGGGYESDMPGFFTLLDDEQIIAVLSYIKSRWPADIRERHDGVNRGGGH
jgi:mono/diheme cytochrome c family protein